MDQYDDIDRMTAIPRLFKKVRWKITGEIKHVIKDDASGAAGYLVHWVASANLNSYQMQSFLKYILWSASSGRGSLEEAAHVASQGVRVEDTIRAASAKKEGFTPEDRRRLCRIEQASVYSKTPTEAQHSSNVRRQQVKYGAELYRPSTRFKKGFSFVQAAKAAINSPDFRDAEGAYSLSEKKTLAQAIRRHVLRIKSAPDT